MFPRRKRNPNRSDIYVGAAQKVPHHTGTTGWRKRIIPKRASACQKFAPISGCPWFPALLIDT